MRLHATSRPTFIEKFKHPYKVIAKVSPPLPTPQPYGGNINHTGVQKLTNSTKLLNYMNFTHPVHSVAKHYNSWPKNWRFGQIVNFRTCSIPDICCLSLTGPICNSVSSSSFSGGENAETAKPSCMVSVNHKNVCHVETLSFCEHFLVKQ